MQPIRFVDLQSQYLAYKEELDKEVLNVLASTKYIGGPQLAKLEEELGDFCSVRAIGCSNGTDALLLALMAAGIKRGDEVITSSFTFVSTVEMICLIGAKPVFVDIDINDAIINPALIEEKISPRTKAIIPISLFGQTAQMDKINSLAAKHSLTVIEDAAQSFGALYKDKKSCALSSYACTSFYPAKGLGCFGDGGALFTPDEDKEQEIRFLLNHGQNKRYEYVSIGINGRLDEIQAAILRVKLRHYPREILRRQELASRYDKALTRMSHLQAVQVPPSNISVYSQYSLYAPLGKRDDFCRQLTEKSIAYAIYYPKPLHMHSIFAPYADGSLPYTEEAAQRIFSIPVHPFLSEEQQEFIIHELGSLS